MIRNGFYYPTEIYRDLKHWDYEKGEVVGKAQMALCFGNRTGGKTVGHGIERIKRFLECGETTMILSRTETQLKEHYLEKWWNGKIFGIRDDEGVIEDFVSNHKIEFELKQIKVDGNPFAYCEPISMSNKVKDEGAYHKCSVIIMDEAVQPGERIMMSQGRPTMSRIFEIWQTVARNWEGALDCTSIVFIANTSSRDNWICRDLAINKFVRKDTKYTVQNGIIFQMVNNKIAAEKVRKSTMGQIMLRSESGKAYFEAAQENAYDDNLAFICQMGLDMRELEIQIKTQVALLGVFRVPGGYHIAEIWDTEKVETICNVPELHTENVRYVRNGTWQERLFNLYTEGRLTFGTLEAKNAFLQFICLLY